MRLIEAVYRPCCCIGDCGGSNIRLHAGFTICTRPHVTDATLLVHLELFDAVVFGGRLQRLKQDPHAEQNYGDHRYLIHCWLMKSTPSLIMTQRLISPASFVLSAVDASLPRAVLPAAKAKFPSHPTSSTIPPSSAFILITIIGR